MRKVAFDHIAIGVPRIEDAVPFLAGELGGRPLGGGVAHAFVFRQWAYGAGKLEVLEPAGAADGFMHRFLERRGPGVHHVTFVVPSLDATCAEAERQGFPVVERDDSDPEWKEAFLHPKGAMSIVVQLVEHTPPPDEDDGGAPAGAGAEAGAPGVVLVGLRLAARDLDRARRLWCGLLAGACRAQGDGFEARWVGSPMRLLVRAPRGAEDEGPLSIELGCLRPAVLPRGPHPVLGAVFEPVDTTELQPPPGGMDAASGGPTEEGHASADERSGRRTEAEEESWFLDGEELDRSSGEPW